jgi:hypothetical protein
MKVVQPVHCGYKPLDNMAELRRTGIWKRNPYEEEALWPPALKAGTGRCVQGSGGQSPSLLSPRPVFVAECANEHQDLTTSYYVVKYYSTIELVVYHKSRRPPILQNIICLYNTASQAPLN